MTREANAGTSKGDRKRAAASTGTFMAVAVPDNWPDTGVMPGPERVPTRVR